jgi:plastocyanin
MSWQPDNAYLQKFANLKIGDKVKYTVNRAWSHDVVNTDRMGVITKINPVTIVIGSYNQDGTINNWTIPKKWMASIKKIK